jgi:hypothetical protein
VAALSVEGRTNFTVAPVAVTDDTVTLVGAANLDVVAAVTDIASVRDGVVTAGTQIASTRNAATQAAATQSFFMHLIMPPMRDFRREVNQKNRRTFSTNSSLLKRLSTPIQTIHDASVTCTPNQNIMAKPALPGRPARVPPLP